MIVKGKIKLIERDTRYGYWTILMHDGNVYRCGQKVVEQIIEKLPLVEMRVEKKNVHTHVEAVF